MTSPRQDDNSISPGLAAELIDDHALIEADQDRLHHEPLAHELAEFVFQVTTPANIALYGPWGGGKSSVGNLLKGELKAHRNSIAFARFDAFKYAETPLRRHFLSQVATELNIDDSKYREDLYRSTQDRRFKLPKIELVKLVAVFLGLLAIVMLLLLVAVAVIAWRETGPFWDNFSDFAKTVTTATLVPTVLLTMSVSLANQTFSIEQTTHASSSDEEFERLFRELVDRVSGERLVVFVDELDRCAPDEVVTTLDTIRTFLDVETCVFIVAADQQVLERALSKRVRQTTPADPTNPYYSSGSAYLDKVFQYQFELPPLRPRRLSRFAIELLRDRGGLWDEIDRDLVVSVLIPTHVRSPRRVKILLNSFALTYRLAKDRAAAGLLGADLRERAPELAKLVCLRAEFPLFAADLVLDARLPRFVLQVGADEGEPEPFPDHVPRLVRERAAMYAEGKLPVDELLIETSDRRKSQRMFRIAAGSSTAQRNGTTTGEELEEEPTQTDTVARTVQAEHTQQLIRYLKKTAHIPGPNHDFIHLESPGEVYGLDPTLAIQLEDDALDGLTDSAIALVLEMDPGDQLRAVQLLANFVREAPVGVEGDNAVSTLFRVIARLNLDMSQVADSAADAVASHRSLSNLPAEDLPGAYLLGLASTRDVGHQLIEHVVRRDEAANDPNLGHLIIRTADQIFEHFADEVALIVASFLARPAHATPTANAMLSLPREMREPLMNDMVEPLADQYLEAESDDEVEAAFSTTLDVFANAGDQPLSESLIEVGILAGFLDDIEEHIGELKPIRSLELSETVLGTVLPAVPITSWAVWLDVLDAAVFSQTKADRQLASLGIDLWSQVSSDLPNVEANQGAIVALGRLISDGTLGEDQELANAIVTAIGSPTEAPPVLQQWTSLISLAKRFVDAGVISAHLIAPSLLNSMHSFLGVGHETQAEDAPMVKVVTEWSPWLLKSADPGASQGFMEATKQSPWLPSPVREQFTLRAAVAAGAPSPYSADELREYATRHRARAANGLAIWIAAYAATP